MQEVHEVTKAASHWRIYTVAPPTRAPLIKPLLKATEASSIWSASCTSWTSSTSCFYRYPIFNGLKHVWLFMYKQKLSWTQIWPQNHLMSISTTYLQEYCRDNILTQSKAVPRRSRGSIISFMSHKHDNLALRESLEAVSWLLKTLGNDVLDDTCYALFEDRKPNISCQTFSFSITLFVMTETNWSAAEPLAPAYRMHSHSSKETIKMEVWFLSIDICRKAKGRVTQLGVIYLFLYTTLRL